MKISGLPGTLPLPKWLTANDIYYFWKDKDGRILNTPRPGSKLTKIPDGCSIKVKGVSFDDVISYQKLLDERGFIALGTKNEGKQFKIFHKIKNSVFAIIWSSEQTEILMMQEPIHLASNLYLDLSK